MSKNAVEKNAVPTILITGMNGQVGWELQRSMVPLGKVVAADRSKLDLSNEKNIRTLIREIKPDIIVNAAAYTAVDKAEEEIELAHKINALAPQVMAEEALALNALLIHYSTDYVFNGEKGKAYTENDVTDPINVYGESKLAGENAIKKVACHYLILRTSWVFASRGNNFLLSMLRLGRERDELNIVADQAGSPTSARLIADATSHIVWQARKELSAEKFTSGLFHLASSGKTSWHGFADEIIQSAKSLMTDVEFAVKEIKPIKTAAYPTPAKRPMNSLLATDKISARFAINLSDWREQVVLCLKEM